MGGARERDRGQWEELERLRAVGGVRDSLIDSLDFMGEDKIRKHMFQLIQPEYSLWPSSE